MSAVHDSTDVREPADWMKPADDRILEAVRQEGNLTPLAASEEGEVERVSIGRKYAGIRMRELSNYGLLRRVDKGLYGLTDEGHAYLNEELDASTLSAENE